MQTTQDPKSDLAPILRVFEASFRSWRYTSVTSVAEELYHSLTLADRPVLEDAEASFERVSAQIEANSIADHSHGGIGNSLRSGQDVADMDGDPEAYDLCVPTDLPTGTEPETIAPYTGLPPTCAALTQRCFRAINVCINESRQTLAQSLFFENETVYIEAVEHAQALLHQFVHGVSAQESEAASTSSVKLAPLSFSISPEEFKLLAGVESGETDINSLNPKVVEHWQDLTWCIQRFDFVGQKLLEAASQAVMPPSEPKESTSPSSGRSGRLQIATSTTSPLRHLVMTFVQFFLQSAMLYVFAAHRTAVASESLAAVRANSGTTSMPTSASQPSTQDGATEVTARLFELDSDAAGASGTHDQHGLTESEVVNTTGPCKALLAGASLLLQYVVLSLRNERESVSGATPMDILAEALEKPLVELVFSPSVDMESALFESSTVSPLSNGSQFQDICENDSLRVAACKSWFAWVAYAKNKPTTAVTGTSITFLALSLVSELQASMTRTPQTSFNAIARAIADQPGDATVARLLNEDFARATSLAADQGCSALPRPSITEARAVDSSVPAILRSKFHAFLAQDALPPHLAFLIEGWQQVVGSTKFNDNSRTQLGGKNSEIAEGATQENETPNSTQGALPPDVIASKTNEWLLRLTARRTALVQFGSPSLSMKVLAILRTATFANVNPQQHPSDPKQWPAAAVPNHGALSPVCDRADSLHLAVTNTCHAASPTTTQTTVDWTNRESDCLLPPRVVLKFHPKTTPKDDMPTLPLSPSDPNGKPSSPILSPVGAPSDAVSSPPMLSESYLQTSSSQAELKELVFNADAITPSVLDRLIPRIFEYDPTKGWFEQTSYHNQSIKTITTHYCMDSRYAHSGSTQFAMVFPTLPTAAQRLRLEGIARGLSRAFGPVSAIDALVLPNPESREDPSVTTPTTEHTEVSLQSLLRTLGVRGIGFRIHTKWSVPPASLEALALACAPANALRALSVEEDTRDHPAPILRLDRSPFFACYAQILSHVLVTIGHRLIVTNHANELRQQRSDHIHVLPAPPGAVSACVSLDGGAAGDSQAPSMFNSSINGSRRGSIAGGALLLVGTNPGSSFGSGALRTRSGSIISNSSEFSNLLKQREAVPRSALMSAAPPPSQHAITLDGRRLTGALLFSASHVIGHSLFVNDAISGGNSSSCGDVASAVYQQLNLPLVVLHVLVQPMVAATLTPPLLAPPLASFTTTFPSIAGSGNHAKDVTATPTFSARSQGHSLRSEPLSTSSCILPNAFKSYPAVFRAYALAQAAAQGRATALVGASAGYFATAQLQTDNMLPQHENEQPLALSQSDPVLHEILSEVTSPLGFSSPLCQNRSRATVYLLRILERCIRDSPLHLLLLARAGIYATLLAPTLTCPELPSASPPLTDQVVGALLAFSSEAHRTAVAKNPHEFDANRSALSAVANFLAAIASPTPRVHTTVMPAALATPFSRLPNAQGLPPLPVTANLGNTSPMVSNLVNKIMSNPWISMYTSLSLPELGFNSAIARPLARLARMTMRAHCALPMRLRETVVGGGAGSKAAAERSSRVVESLRAAMGDLAIHKLAEVYRGAALTVAMSRIVNTPGEGLNSEASEAIRADFKRVYSVLVQGHNQDTTSTDADALFNFSYSHYQRAASGSADVNGAQTVLQQIDTELVRSLSPAKAKESTEPTSDQQTSKNAMSTESSAPTTTPTVDDIPVAPQVTSAAQRGVPGSNRFAARHQRVRSFGAGNANANADAPSAGAGPVPATPPVEDEGSDEAEHRAPDGKLGAVAAAKSRLLQRNWKMRLYSWRGGAGNNNGPSNQDDSSSDSRGRSGTARLGDTELDLDVQFKRWSQTLAATIHDDQISFVHPPNWKLRPIDYIYFQDNACDDFDDFAPGTHLTSTSYATGDIGGLRALADDWACAASPTELNETSPEYMSLVLALKAARRAAVSEISKRSVMLLENSGSALVAATAPYVIEAAQPSTRLSPSSDRLVEDFVSEAQLEEDWNILLGSITSQSVPLK